MPEKIARVQATIYVTTHLSIAPKIQQDSETRQYTSWPNAREHIYFKHSAQHRQLLAAHENPTKAER